MHVTRVELENIKSHAHSVFTFERGTTAITGENGAGKTTILEAIAWALFDVLDYKKEDFLRRGAKKGSVRVTFETSPDVDGRQYVVYRDTGQGYYIHDPRANLRIAEKKADVGVTLRRLLGINEPGTDLEALFRSAVGVPQGMFTADFLLRPSERKAAFDRLLKVEEYRDGAERLRDTVRLIHERVADINVRIGKAEGQLVNYDLFVEERREVKSLLEETETELVRLRGQIAARARVVEEMDAAERRVTETRARFERLGVEQEAAARRLYDLSLEYQERSQRSEAQLLGEFEAASASMVAVIGDLIIVDESRRLRVEMLKLADDELPQLISVEIYDRG